ncbi:MAG: hypothetical protein E7022_09980 [Desulfovibrio desulfuricans]|nr:hypothetical protein [Desulfovibrio desulfuricans]
MKLSLPQLQRLAGAHGDAFYLLDSDRFADNFRKFLAAFRAVYPRTDIAYSYKTNYIPALCKLVDHLGGKAEVVSPMEYELAVRLGVRPENIFFNGPYKQPPFLRRALLDGARVNLDSFAELRVAADLARECPQRIISLGLRCNFAMDNGEVSRFGLDVDGPQWQEALHLAAQTSNLIVAGLHCHYPMRELASFVARTRGMASLLRRGDLPPLRYVSFGGGYYGSISDEFAAALGVAPPSWDEYTAVVAGAMREFFGEEGPHLVVEPGTALVADAMCLATRVVSLKTVRGRHIATLAASIDDVNPRAAGVQRPVQVFPTDAGARTERVWDLTGYTCMENDCLYHGYEGSLAEGDIVVFHHVGSYSVVFKPPFILPALPVIDLGGGVERVVKRRENLDDIFATYADM